MMPPPLSSVGPSVEKAAPLLLAPDQEIIIVSVYVFLYHAMLTSVLLQLLHIKPYRLGV